MTTLSSTDLTGIAGKEELAATVEIRRTVQTPDIATMHLRAHYDRIKARRGTTDARTPTARKIAELTWTVWTQRRCYEEC